MDVLLQITPVGDTTSREISVASQELRDVLEHLPGVARIDRNAPNTPQFCGLEIVNTVPASDRSRTAFPSHSPVRIGQFMN